MRIIAGTGRGRPLSAPPGIITRPTSDRVKEALFNILGARIDFTGISVLDLCAGSGSLGIEALSRGAGYCCFVEHDRSVLGVLEKNLAATGFIGFSECVGMDVVQAVRSNSIFRQVFDLIFFDPPYREELYFPVLEGVGQSSIMAPEALLVAECSTRNPLSETYGCLKHLDRRVYGDTALEFYRLEE